jgi:hypothetical protein
MTGKTACICLLAAGTVFASGLPQIHAQQSNSAGQAITIFFTGNELGAMKPCGCSGGQLGGLDRRYAVLNSVSPENRLIIDTGSLVPESTEQNLIKFNVIVQAFNQLGYDLVNLTEQDILIARQAGLLDGISSVFNCITADSPDDVKLPAKFTKKFTLNGSSVDIAVAVVETEDHVSRLPELLASPAESPSAVKILILNRIDIKPVVPVNLVDVLIVPPHSDEPMLISDANARPLVISAGRLGKYVGKIQIVLPDQSGNTRLSFSSLPVTEDLQQFQPLVELYKDYQRLVREANLIEKYPRFVLPDNLEYVGSRSCKLCHDYEYEKWLISGQVFIPGLAKQASSDSRHADAYATLEKVNSHYDPECVICHVIGMRYESGYISPAQTPEMKDVGCENCHGPGSEHIRSLGAAETAGPISTCTDCHTTEHSAEYGSNEKQYFDKIIHWRQPLSRVKVAEPNREK